jgi:hypothetical protein
MTRVWTNDIYVSNLHRVVNRTGKELDRRSSTSTTTRRRVPALPVTGHWPKYPPISSGEYLVKRSRRPAVYGKPVRWTNSAGDLRDVAVLEAGSARRSRQADRPARAGGGGPAVTTHATPRHLHVW